MLESRQQRGFSMLEVLVTLLLISISVLGMVAMQAKSISFTQDSLQRNKAAVLADDLMELMRADSVQVVGLNGLPRTSSDYFKASGSAFADPPDSCSPLPDAAEERLACWAQSAFTALPDASTLSESEFHICRSPTPGVCDSSAGSAVEIQLAWRVKAGDCLDTSAAEDDDDTVCHYRLRAEL